MNGKGMFYIHVPVGPARVYKVNRYQKKPPRMKNVILVRRCQMAPPPMGMLHMTPPPPVMHVTR